jgi:apolipoprotein N-acyltransferase
MLAQEAALSRSPDFAGDIAVLSKTASSSPISLFRLMCAMMAWASRISLFVNFWWSVVGFVDFVVEFCWFVVAGVGFFFFFFFNCGGFCWIFVDFVVGFVGL